MPRIADTAKEITVTATELHEHDYIVGTGGKILIVENVTRRNGEVKVAYWARDTEQQWVGTHTVATDTLVTVKVEHGCDCDGRGIFRWGGGTENGVFTGKTGVHFACAGKGWQDRSDVIRNSTYWNKYARIYA